MSKKFWPNSYSKLLYKMIQEVLDKHYVKRELYTNYDAGLRI